MFTRFLQRLKGVGFVQQHCFNLKCSTILKCDSVPASPFTSEKYREHVSVRVRRTVNCTELGRGVPIGATMEQDGSLLQRNTA